MSESARLQPALTNEFCYALSGEGYGPVSLAQLSALVADGTIGPDDLVWRAGETISHRAASVPELAAAFSAIPVAAPPMLGYATAFNERDVLHARKHLDRITSACRTFGIVTGVVLLLMYNLPFATPEGPIWWWQAMRGAPVAFQLLLVFIPLGGLGLCIAAFAARGLARGITFAVIPLVGAALLLLGLLGRTGGFAEFSNLLSFLPVLLTAGVFAAADFRVRAPRSTIGRIWLAAVGGPLLIVTLIIVGVTAHSFVVELRRMSKFGYSPPSGLIAILVVSGIGHLCSIIAGIAALLALSPRTRNAYRLAQGFSVPAFFAPGLAVLILVISLLNGMGVSGGQLIFFIFRIVTILYCLLAPAAAGLSEILATMHFEPITRIRPSIPTSPATAL